MSNKPTNRPDVPKCFIANLMSGTKMKLDADELSKVALALQSGGSCWVRQGLFNAKSFSDIVRDTRREQEYREQLAQTEQHNDRDENYDGGKNQKPYPEFKRLENVFEGVDLTSKLQAKPSTPQLG